MANLPSSARVVIVGGGIVGCSVAYHLAKRGVTDVVLLEREPQLATGSTGRNAGGFRHQFSNSANIELSIESIRFMKNFESIVGSPIDFHQDGYLFLPGFFARQDVIEARKLLTAALAEKGLLDPAFPVMDAVKKEGADMKRQRYVDKNRTYGYVRTYDCRCFRRGWCPG